MRTAILLASFLLLLSAQSVHGQHLLILDTITDGNLTIYLLGSDRTEIKRHYLTLDEAIRSHKATLRETGTTNLQIENHSDEDIFIQSGSIVKGGQQDRMLANDMIIAAGGEPVAIPAYCVEHDRSFQRGLERLGEFSAANVIAPIPSLRARANLPLLERPSQVTSGTGDGLTAPSDSSHSTATGNEQALLNQLAAYESRSVFQESIPQKALQSAIWKDVRNVQSKLSEVSGHSVQDPRSHSSLELSLEDVTDSAHLHSLMGRIDRKSGAIRGLAYAINGELRSADIYGSGALFRSEATGLLASMIVDARISRSSEHTTSVDNEEVLRFLQFLPGEVVVRDLSVREQVRLYSAGGNYRFETFDSLESSTLLHVAILKADLQ